MIESNAKEIENNVAAFDDGDLVEFENKLRPRSFEEYIGQPQIKENLIISIAGAQKRKESLDHILLHGAPGLGKTTLANIIATENSASIKTCSAPSLEKQGDIAALISNLQDGDILFIDEIHRLKPTIEEILYSAMEDYVIDIMIGTGPSARNMRINLPRFTLIGATTKMSLLSGPLRDRFGSIYRLQFYNHDDIAEIILRSAKILDVEISRDVAKILARSCRQTPRVANRLLKKVRDFVQYKNKKTIDKKILEESLRACGIDELGLDHTDRELLKIIIEKFKGGPVGLNTLSAAVSEDRLTIEEVYEPFLIKMGFLERSNRGRVATEKAYTHLGIML